MLCKPLLPNEDHCCPRTVHSRTSNNHTKLTRKYNTLKKGFVQRLACDESFGGIQNDPRRHARIPPLESFVFLVMLSESRSIQPDIKYFRCRRLSAQMQGLKATKKMTNQTHDTRFDREVIKRNLTKNPANQIEKIKGHRCDPAATSEQLRLPLLGRGEHLSCSRTNPERSPNLSIEGKK